MRTCSTLLLLLSSPALSPRKVTNRSLRSTRHLSLAVTLETEPHFDWSSVWYQRLRGNCSSVCLERVRLGVELCVLVRAQLEGPAASCEWAGRRSFTFSVSVLGSPEEQTWQKVIHTHMHVVAHIHMHTHTIHVHTPMHIYAHAYTIHTALHLYMYIHVHICLYMYIKGDLA